MSGEPQREREYERWLRGRGLNSIVIRWVMSGAGQWLINTPLMKLPENLVVTADQRWLDVGSGRGTLLRLVDERVRFEQSPVGLDFTPSALRLARRDAQRKGQPIDLAAGTATALPFADQTFNLVTCGYMLKHLTDEELDAFLLEVRRVLVGGGLALLWEFAPTGSGRLDAWNRALLGAAVAEPKLRRQSVLRDRAQAAGFEYIRDASLRPFIFPPIPRASLLVGRAPEGWMPD